MLFLADDYRANFDEITRELTIPSNPSLYIHAPARLDPSMAPAGEDTLIAAIPVGHMSEHETYDWPALTAQARHKVFRRLALLGITDLEAHRATPRGLLRRSIDGPWMIAFARIMQRVRFDLHEFARSIEASSA